MSLVTKDWKWEKKDLWEQPLHMLMGGSLPLVVIILASVFPLIKPFIWFIIPPAAAVALGLCAWREWRQHPGRLINTDSIFLTLGNVLSVLLAVYLF